MLVIMDQPLSEASSAQCASCLGLGEVRRDSGTGLCSLLAGCLRIECETWVP